MAVIYRGTGKSGRSIITTDKSKVDTSKSFTSEPAPSNTKTSNTNSSSNKTSSAPPVFASGGKTIAEKTGTIITPPKTLSGVTPLNQGKTDLLTIVTVDPKTGKETITRRGRTNSGYTGLPSIAPPSPQAISDFYASQKVDTTQGASINERVLAQELARPGSVQTVSQGFMQPGSVKGADVALAQSALQKPVSQRTYQEQVAIIQAAQGSQAYQAEAQRQAESQARLKQQLASKEIPRTSMTPLLETQQPTKPIIADVKMSGRYVAPTGAAAEGIRSIPGQIVEGAKETLIDIPFAFGASVGKEAKVRGDYTQIPKIIGEKVGAGLISAGTLIATNPIGVASSTLESFLTKPFKFTTSLLITSIAIGGAKNLIGKGFAKITTVGKKYIPESELVAPEVTKGLKNFPTTKSATSALKEFNKTGYATATGKKVVYSATDYSFIPIVGRKITVTSGRGLVKGVDVPGLYTSIKGVSTYFLRLKEGLGQYKLFPSSLKELLPTQPKILAIAQTPSRIPSAFRTTLSKAQSYFGKEGLKLTTPKGVPGKPYVSPALEFGLKNEAEAVIQVGSKLQRTGLTSVWDKITGFSKYTKIQGNIVPIYEFNVVGKGVVKGVSEKVSAVSYGSYSSGLGSKVLVSPKVVASSIRLPKYESSLVSSVKVPRSVSSYKFSSVKTPSYVSPKISSISLSSVKPSYVPSKTISRVSSGGSTTSSIIVPSTTPSYTQPSYTTPSKISYKLTPSGTPSRNPFNYIIPKITSKKIKRLSEKEIKYDLKKKKKLNLKKAFSVSTRIKGKEKVLALGVPRNLALAIGKSFTGKTTARSFKIKEIGVTQREDIGNQDLTQYRMPKVGGRVGREGFTFVEKSRFAINTPGEVRELKAGRINAKLFK